jgi:hypothetical protein
MSVVARRYRINRYKFVFAQILKIGAHGAFVATIDCPGHIFQVQNPEAPDFAEQRLFFLPQADATNLHGNSFARAPGAHFPFPLAAPLIRLTVTPALIVRNFNGARLAFFRLLVEQWKSAVKWRVVPFRPPCICSFRWVNIPVPRERNLWFTRQIESHRLPPRAESSACLHWIDLYAHE